MNFEKILSAIDDDQDEPPTGFFGNVFGHLLKEKQKEAAAFAVSTKQSESETQNKTDQLLTNNNAVIGNNETSTKTTTTAPSTIVTSTNLNSSSSGSGSSPKNVSVSSNQYDQQLYYPNCPPLDKIEEQWKYFWFKFVKTASSEEPLTKANKDDVPGWLFIQKVLRKMNMLYPIYENQLQQLVNKGKMTWMYSDENNINRSLIMASIFCSLFRRGYQLSNSLQTRQPQQSQPQSQPQLLPSQHPAVTTTTESRSKQNSPRTTAASSLYKNTTNTSTSLPTNSQLLQNDIQSISAELEEMKHQNIQLQRKIFAEEEYQWYLHFAALTEYFKTNTYEQLLSNPYYTCSLENFNDNNQPYLYSGNLLQFIEIHREFKRNHKIPEQLDRTKSYHRRLILFNQLAGELGKLFISKTFIHFIVISNCSVVHEFIIFLLMNSNILF